MFRSKIVANRVRSKVLVTLKSGEAFEGVLWDADREALVMRGAALVGGVVQREHMPVDGEVVVLLVDVSYIQIL